MMNTGLQFVFSVASMIQSSTLSFTSEADVVEKNILNDFIKWFCKNKKTRLLRKILNQNRLWLVLELDPLSDKYLYSLKM